MAERIDDTFFDDPTAACNHMRETAPVACVLLPDGVRVWIISRHADVTAALTDERLSHNASTALRARRAEAGHPEFSHGLHTANHMLVVDGDAHTTLRKPVEPAFTRGRVEALRQRIQTLAHQALDPLPRHEPIDVMAEFAVPFPLNVICELLGVPEPHRGALRGWASTLMTDERDRAAAAPRQANASQQISLYFDSLVAAKRLTPGDDLISTLIDAVDTGTLTDKELLTTLTLLIIAGSETTTNAIGNGVRHLLTDRERWRGLHDQKSKSLVVGAVEELLRYDSPVRMTPYRETLEDVEYSGVTIPRGELVLLSLQAANRDPRVFANPDELDPLRNPRGHIAFGHGIHHCLGARLARMQIDIAFSVLTDRFPNARLCQPDEITHRRNVMLNGYDHVWVQLAG